MHRSTWTIIILICIYIYTDTIPKQTPFLIGLKRAVRSTHKAFAKHERSVGVTAFIHNVFHYFQNNSHNPPCSILTYVVALFSFQGDF
jgi:hypothetical protein